jgi:dienelactone hydrolase
MALVVAAPAVVHATPPPPDIPRTHAFKATTPEEAHRWQEESRRRLFELLKIETLRKQLRPDPLGPSTLPLAYRQYYGIDTGHYHFTSFAFRVTPNRLGMAVVSIPHGEGPFPAVVCVHGHHSNRDSVHSRASNYQGFASVLAESGYVTISADVGQHELFEPQHTLMGEWIWTLMRAVDVLQSMDRVDPTRLAVAGLSLGGELAMWLAALDLRIRAAVVAGWLASTDDLERGTHCPCWNFEGFTDAFDFPDVFTLIAPRPLLLQHGERDPEFSFTEGLTTYQRIEAGYEVRGSKERLQLQVHPGGHVFEPTEAKLFLDTVLNVEPTGREAISNRLPEDASPPFWLFFALGAISIVSLSHSLLLHRRLHSFRMSNRR